MKVGDRVVYRMANGESVPARIINLPMVSYADIEIDLADGRKAQYSYVRLTKLEWPNGKEAHH